MSFLAHRTCGTSISPHQNWLLLKVIKARTSVPSETEGSRNDSRAVKERAAKMGEGIWNGGGRVLHYNERSFLFY